MTIITLANQKGGVAKTTTCNALASGLLHKGYRVLAIDLDPQCNLSLSCGADILSLENTIYNVFKGESSTSSIVIKIPIGYDLIPGGLDLAGADMEFTQLGREKLLLKALLPIKDNYDYIIIDTPPTLGILTANALIASDYVIVPMAADIYSLQGLSQLNGFIQNVHENGNPHLQIAGLLITKYNSRQNISKILIEQIENAAEQLQTKVFTTHIRESVAIRESALLQSDIFKEVPKANATVDYNQFIDEFLGGIENDN